MKKKGLIISTVVMVVVLIASLTTATYAWFTTSDKTTIEGFNVEVVSGNAVNIGVKADNKHVSGKAVTADMFYNGSVTYTNGTAGVLGGGSWVGDYVGLGANLTHDIVWGAQSAAVGAIKTTDNTTPSTDATQYGSIATIFNDGETAFVNAANKSKNNALADVVPALANKNGKKYEGDDTPAGDYAYLFLGASPSKALTSNELVIMLDGSESKGTTIGMLAAVHVAYRVTKAGAEQATTAWTEVSFFEGKTYNESLAGATLSMTESQVSAYKTAFGATTAPTSRASIVVISDLAKVQNDIDQIEIIIYIDGTDPDCRDEAKGASGAIKVFFNAVPVEG